MVFLSVSSHPTMEQDEVDVERPDMHSGVDHCPTALVNMGLRFGIPRKKCVSWAVDSKH